MSEAMPGVSVDLPIVPEMAETFGYRGNARYVSFAHSPIGDQAICDDGRSSGTAATWAFIAYRRHRAVEPLLRDADLGYSDAEASQCLLFDRQDNRVTIAPVDEAREFLQAQHPEPPPLTEEQRAELQRRAEELIAQGWREVKVDQAEVMRQMAEQRGRMARMVSWLDMAPVPERGRE